MRKGAVLALWMMVLLTAGVVHAAPPDSLERVTRPWKGDLSAILKERRPLRVLVSYNRTNFFVDRGAMRGMEHDLMQAYRKYLTKHHAADHVRMVFIAVPFDDLIPALTEGRGDVIAAGLTVTPARKKDIAFSHAYLKNVSEVVVGSSLATPVRKLPDLSDRTVHVMRGSSYVIHLRKANDRLERNGHDPIEIREAELHLVTEDILEMADRGLIQYTVADSHMLDIWKEAMPNLHPFDLTLHEGGKLAWAVRKDCPQLLKSLNAFVDTVEPGTLLGNMVFKRYYENTDWIKAPYALSQDQELLSLKGVLQKYAEKYDFDWTKLAAIAFQESRLNMDTTSSAGAVGIMQVRPSTALDPNVNVKDYKTLDGNVHAGTKYLRFLMDRYFSDVEPDTRVDFALAAYNAGPARVAKLRKQAKAMGLNPNVWFGNVEWAAYKDIGTETPTYVANIQMYYAAYKSIFETVSPRAYRPD